MRTFLLTLVVLVAATTSEAFTIAEYRKIRANPGSSSTLFLGWYVAGIANGLNAANTELNHPLFCPPDKLALGTGNYLDILDRQIARLESLNPQAFWQDFGRAPILGMFLLGGLKETFPCSEQR